MKKSIALIVIVFLSSLVAFTTPALLKNTKIGLKFKGGYEILYVAASTKPRTSVEKTAEILTSLVTFSFYALFFSS